MNYIKHRRPMAQGNARIVFVITLGIGQGIFRKAVENIVPDQQAGYVMGGFVADTGELAGKCLVAPLENDGQRKRDTIGDEEFTQRDTTTPYHRDIVQDFGRTTVGLDLQAAPIIKRNAHTCISIPLDRVGYE